MDLWPILQSLALLTFANGTPVIAKKIFGSRLAFPLDAGVLFVDGRPLLGQSKTIRGVVLSVAVTAAAAPVLGVSVATGALVGCLAMLGDIISSFIKRRLKLPSSAQAVGLDQIPESLLPLVVCQNALSLTWVDIIICAGIFLVGELMISRVLYMLHIRDQPY
ncbi:CDP-archaeol synthase [Bradyrhizobium sp. Leo170]|uniref:CDP-archaeol synthase n=2 Tax=unclassified Bradyrhizobium TaxID=2631580 RepID=UPI00102EAB0D|nr:CDP-archaeol synthase [Bradyrhizobium sp. Leo170]TAI66575.1 CDP-archaeol synthase [Bradyrhizobium sp. Leo170]